MQNSYKINCFYIAVCYIKSTLSADDNDYFTPMVNKQGEFIPSNFSLSYIRNKNNNNNIGAATSIEQGRANAGMAESRSRAYPNFNNLHVMKEDGVFNNQDFSPYKSITSGLVSNINTQSSLNINTPQNLRRMPNHENSTSSDEEEEEEEEEEDGNEDACMKIALAKYKSAIINAQPDVMRSGNQETPCFKNNNDIILNRPLGINRKVDPVICSSSDDLYNLPSNSSYQDMQNTEGLIGKYSSFTPSINRYPSLDFVPNPIQYQKTLSHKNNPFKNDQRVKLRQGQIEEQQFVENEDALSNSSYSKYSEKIYINKGNSEESDKLSSFSQDGSAEKQKSCCEDICTSCCFI